MATTDQLEQWLAEAEAAYQQIVTAGNPQSVSSGTGKSVTYSATTLPALAAHIAALKARLGRSAYRPLSFQVGGHWRNTPGRWRKPPSDAAEALES